MSNRWKIKRDVNKEDNVLGMEVAAAQKYLESEKKWSKNVGMLGAFLAPMIVASTVFTGGAAMPLWAGALSAGAGALAGAKLGEEIKEAQAKGGKGWKVGQKGEDKYSTGASISGGKFNKKDRREVKSSLIGMADDLDKGMIKDAGIAAVMYGIGKGGAPVKESIKGGIKGALTSNKTLWDASKATFKESLLGTAEQRAKNKSIGLFGGYFKDKTKDAIKGAGVDAVKGNVNTNLIDSALNASTVGESTSSDLINSTVGISSEETKVFMAENFGEEITNAGINADAITAPSNYAGDTLDIRKSVKNGNMFENVSNVKPNNPNALSPTGGLSDAEYLTQNVKGFLDFGKNSGMLKNMKNMKNPDMASLFSAFNQYSKNKENENEQKV